MSAKQSRRTSANVSPQKTNQLVPGEHQALIKAILDEFVPHFAPGSVPIYARSTHGKPSHFDDDRLAQLGVNVDAHAQMPDVALHDPKNNRLFLVEAITGNGLVNANRRKELTRLFANAAPHLIYVTAFPNRSIAGCYFPNIAWETEVWVADAPSHLIHLNGSRFLGPYSKPS
ncbi:MAG: hypothetical protein HZA59_06605 [Hydrogenophilales bacterium]|nr:hypothetical protein [Hydrogenophilales bacterium]